MDAPGPARPDPMGSARPGERWVIRHRLPDGSATDVVGWLSAVGPSTVDVAVTPADVRHVDLATVIVARRAPAAAGGPDPRRTGAADLELIALSGWLGEHEALGEWTLRHAGGFTGRANSCLAVGDPGVPYAAAAERIRAHAADRGIVPRAQVVRGSAEEHGLRELGWQPAYVPTVVLAARLADLLGTTPPAMQVDVADRLSDEWLAGYRESRSDPVEDRWLRMILDGRPPRAFASCADPSGRLIAIGRGHLERDWLGVAAVWTRPEHRRRGRGAAIVLALGHWAARNGARYAYLQVAESNTTALRAYERLGLRPHHSYGYLEPGLNG